MKAMLKTLQMLPVDYSLLVTCCFPHCSMSTVIPSTTFWIWGVLGSFVEACLIKIEYTLHLVFKQYSG